MTVAAMYHGRGCYSNGDWEDGWFLSSRRASSDFMIHSENPTQQYLQITTNAHAIWRSDDKEEAIMIRRIIASVSGCAEIQAAQTESG